MNEIVKQKPGRLYIVATPIGNLGDMTPRSIETLKAVDCIAAEDTRHSLPLMRHFEIHSPLIAYHDHNERDQSKRLLERIEQGENIALISDAGTPLISDPGYQLVHMARERSLEVIAIPGASALISALSISGLPTDRFIFEGFLPAKKEARCKTLAALQKETRTLIWYESGRRLLESLGDMADIFGPERFGVIAKELTKRFEQVKAGAIETIIHWLKEDNDRLRGEFVVLIKGHTIKDSDAESDPELTRLLSILITELPIKQAVKLAVKITDKNRNELYSLALKLSKNHS